MDIAIVGGGAAAVSLLDALAVTQGSADTLGVPGTDAGTAVDGEPRTITVFEPSPHLWRGRPYGPDLDSVLVNAPPAIMSVRHGDFGHYTAWLGERGSDHIDELLGQPLIPRALYGDYLAESAEKAMAALGEQGWVVRVVTAAVSEVVAEAARSGTRRLVLRTQDTKNTKNTQGRQGRQGRQNTQEAKEYEATHVVLCVGQGTPPDPYGLVGNPRFTPDPYPLADTLDRIPAGGGVAIVGSGLTAVDIVTSLAARGHRGHITLLSRSGMLPHVWQRPDGRRPEHVTVERVAALHAAQGRVTLDDLRELLRAELAVAGEDADELVTGLLATPAQDPGRRNEWLARQIAAVESPRIGRRVLQETAHTVGPYAWRLLSEADRARLSRHLRTATSVASPMVPVNASILMRLLDSGQLTITPGLQGIEPTANGRFRIRHDGGERTAEFIVNAVNPPPHTVPAAARHLVESLVDTGLAILHRQGGLSPSDPRVQVVGDLAAAGSFITSSIPGVAAQASRAAQALLTPPHPRLQA
ncbi:FAD/NAD(P)-binding protein [Streptomyces aurantiacus]|uniref:FAD/NAD(P)-binding protein n=1 Tax=Streptomyces aurantiacus TaxID=47760 RepID=UPI003331CA8A